MRGDVRAGRREAADDRGARSVQRGLDCRSAGYGEERTRNIRYMVVTLEVFQLEMSASKFCML